MGSGPTDHWAGAAAVSAAVLGMTNAAVSVYWAVGGQGLLATIGGDLERWGRERSPAVVAGLWAIAGLKVAVALAAPILVGCGRGRLPVLASGRVARALGWVAAVVLTVYGGVLTAVGLLVQSGVIDAGPDANSTALAWHAYVWDPWFTVWGLAFVVALWRSRDRPATRR